MTHGGVASGAIVAPTTIDGPSVEGLSLDGVAMAPDGTGGLVYTKTVEGVPHVFVSRYAAGQWGPPIRADWGIPYEAGQAAISAGPGGRLMVAWVTQVATLPSGEIRFGLYSATLGPGTAEFAPALLVDPNVTKGAGVSPSIAGTVPGKAVIAYRVVTKTFGVAGENTTAAQLRPGDVLAEIRVARLEGDRWSRLGPVNRFLSVSMRPPTEENGPKVAIGRTGRAVVAWQEPDQTGAARVWMRRVDGTTLGPVLAASPTTFEGKPISEDATAMAVAMTGDDRARVAVRVDGTPTSALAGQRVFLTSLASSSSPQGGKPVGPELVDGGPPGGTVGPPALATADNTGAEGAMNLAFSAGTGLKIVGVDNQGKVTSPESPSGPPADPGGRVVASVDGEGGGTVAYEADDAEGGPAVAVREDFPGGGIQTGLLYGPVGGPVSQLVGDGVESGDALLAFRQGETGYSAIVADRITSPPQQFWLQVPKRWVRPGQALIRWGAAPSGVGGITYGVMVDGQLVTAGLSQRQVVPRRVLLGSGVRSVQVTATDGLGEEAISKVAKLRVDAEPPRLGVQVNHGKGIVVLRLKDAQSGLKGTATKVTFGDGSKARGSATLRHHYAEAGTYVIRVHAEDRVHNRLVRSIRVAVR
jgi:hypothetical protein